MQSRTTIKVPPRRDLAFRTVQDMRDFSRLHAPTALQTLVDIIKDPHVKAASRVSACREILDRGFGRPMQQVIVDQPDQKIIIDLVSDAEYSVSKVMDLPVMDQTNDDESLPNGKDKNE